MGRRQQLVCAHCSPPSNIGLHINAAPQQRLCLSHFERMYRWRYSMSTIQRGKAISRPANRSSSIAFPTFWLVDTLESTLSWAFSKKHQMGSVACAQTKTKGKKGAMGVELMTCVYACIWCEKQLFFFPNTQINVKMEYGVVNWSLMPSTRSCVVLFKHLTLFFLL